jgi:hypothetical protein
MRQLVECDLAMTDPHQAAIRTGGAKTRFSSAIEDKQVCLVEIGRDRISDFDAMHAMHQCNHVDAPASRWMKLSEPVISVVESRAIELHRLALRLMQLDMWLGRNSDRVVAIAKSGDRGRHLDTGRRRRRIVRPTWSQAGSSSADRKRRLRRGRIGRAGGKPRVRPNCVTRPSQCRGAPPSSRASSGSVVA